MAKGKLGLHVYVGTLLVLAKPSEGHNDDGTIGIENDESCKDAAVRRVKL
jgi:hypothetical protein